MCDSTTQWQGHKNTNFNSHGHNVKTVSSFTQLQPNEQRQNPSNQCSLQYDPKCQQCYRCQMQFMFWIVLIFPLINPVALEFFCFVFKDFYKSGDKWSMFSQWVNFQIIIFLCFFFFPEIFTYTGSIGKWTACDHTIVLIVGFCNLLWQDEGLRKKNI